MVKGEPKKTPKKNAVVVNRRGKTKYTSETRRNLNGRKNNERMAN